MHHHAVRERERERDAGGCRSASDGSLTVTRHAHRQARQIWKAALASKQAIGSRRGRDTLSRIDWRYLLGLARKPTQPKIGHPSSLGTPATGCTSEARSTRSATSTVHRRDARTGSTYGKCVAQERGVGEQTTEQQEQQQASGKDQAKPRERRPQVLAEDHGGGSRRGRERGSGAARAQGREAHSGGRQRAVARDMAARPLSLIPLLLPAPRDRGTRERRDEIG